MGLKLRADAGTTMLPDRAAQLTGDTVLKVTGPVNGPVGGAAADDDVIPEYANDAEYIRSVVEPMARMDPNDPRLR